MIRRTLLTRALPAAVIIAAAGLGGFLAYGYLARPQPPLERAAAPIGTPSPDTAGAQTPRFAGHALPRKAVPDTLPDIAFADRGGVARRLPDWKGHPLLVNFWAPWCAPCREEIPLLEHLSRHAPGGLQVIGVGVDSRAAVLAYARRAAIRYPLLIGERPGLQAVRALGMQAVFPFSVFVDASGQIVTLKVGELRAAQAALILDRIHDLDRGRIDLATARQEIADGLARLAVTRAQEAASARF